MKRLKNKMVFFIITVCSVLPTSVAKSSGGGCGDLQISSLFQRLGLNDQDRATMREVIDLALTKSSKTPEDIQQILTRSEFDAEDRLGFGAEDRAMDMGPQLDVLTSRERTKILIRFTDGSFQAVSVSYDGDSRRREVLD